MFDKIIGFATKKVQRLQQQQQRRRQQQRQQQRRRQRQQHRFISRKMMNVFLSFILPLIMRSFDKLIDVFVVVGVAGVTAAALLATHLHIEGQSQQQQRHQ